MDYYYKCHFGDHPVAGDSKMYSFRVLEPSQQRSDVQPRVCCPDCGQALQDRKVEKLNPRTQPAEREQLRQQLARPEVRVMGNQERRPEQHSISLGLRPLEQGGEKDPETRRWLECEQAYQRRQAERAQRIDHNRGPDGGCSL